LFVEHPLPVDGAKAGAATPLLLAKASASFLLAAVREETEAVRDRLAAISR
jgi:hypothetical protein